MINKGVGSGVVVADKQRVAVMINEEDHLRMQVIRSGLNLRTAWKMLDSIDSELEHYVSYAFSPELGYLTACPSNVGIGMRVSVMVHLPGLKLLGEIDQVITGLNRMGMAVRGTFGEGSDDFGNMYQVSNQPTLGVSEDDVVKRVNDVAKILVELETNARARLMKNREIYVRDYVNRAYGISKYAEVISSGEALDLLSALRFGIEFDMLSGVSLSRITELMLLIQPGHLQKNAKNELSVFDRDILRSQLIRKKIKGIELKS
jgi:protein arginine kinase